MEEICEVATRIRRVGEPGESWRKNYAGLVSTTVLKTNLQLVDSHKTSTYQQILDMSEIDGVEQHTYWNRCACNEIDALDRRHYPDDLPELWDPVHGLQELYVKNWDLFILGLKNTQPYAPVSHTEMMSTCRPHIKKRYQNAYDQIRERRVIFGKSQSKTKFFVKFEKIPTSKIEAGKAPRCIQYRDFKYMYAFKRSFLPITKAIKKCAELNVFGQVVNTIFTKNMLGCAIADNMRSLWLAFKNPVAVCLDHRNYDGHYCRPLIGVANKMWKKYAGCDNITRKTRLLARLLDEQFKTTGYSNNGVKFNASGKRCSGEFTTSDENGVANKHIIESVFEWIIYMLLDMGVLKGKFEDWIVYLQVNGDDSVIMLEHELWMAINKHIGDDWLNTFKSLNQETEMDISTYHFEQISYCQASPVCIDGNWLMVKKPLRTLSRVCYTDKKLDEKTVLRYYRSLGLCELAGSAGVPILQTLALRLLELAQGARPLGKVDKVWAKSMNQGRIRFKPVTRDSRLSFERAFGIAPETQLAIEAIISGREYRTKQATNLIGTYTNFHLN